MIDLRWTVSQFSLRRSRNDRFTVDRHTAVVAETRCERTSGLRDTRFAMETADDMVKALHFSVDFMLVFASMIECGVSLEGRGEGARHHVDRVSQKARNADPPDRDRGRMIDQSGDSGQGCIASYTWTYRARPLRRGGRRCGGQDTARNGRLRAAASGNIGCGKSTSVHAL